MPTIISSLFVYGTLCDRQLRHRLLGREVKAVPARLPGFVKVSIPAFPYPALARAPFQTTEGQLLLGLTPEDLKRLDRYEGREYRRALCSVWAQGKRVRAWVYLWRNEKLLAS